MMYEDYEDLVEWLIEVITLQDIANVLFFHLFPLIQTCDFINIDLPTKFLARTYFDTTLHFESQVALGELTKLAITCLSLAIKVTLLLVSCFTIRTSMIVILPNTCILWLAWKYQLKSLSN